MSRATSLPLTPAYANERFTVRGDTLLYAGIPRVPIDELRILLSRGSGYVVRGGQRYATYHALTPRLLTVCVLLRSKMWFQAQCAHYGLPSDEKLAMLRLYLEKSLESFQERMREKAERGEKERLAMEKKPEAIRSPTIRRPHSGSISSQKCAGALTMLRSTSELPTSNPTKNAIPPRTSLPAITSVSKPTRRNSELKAFEQVKLSMKFSGPNSSGTDTESESDNSFSASESQATFPPPGLLSPLFSLDPFRPRGNRAQPLRLENDVVSGRWALHVTCSTMAPLPAPWRAASSKWLRGNMNVHLSCDRRALNAEFALFGLDGVIKSRKFEPRGEGVCAWVKFVAQMPVTTAERPGEVGLEDTRVFGPSVMQYGYLRFYEDGRVRGMLRCRRYGRLEFEGARIGQAGPMLAKWSDFM
ncbi:hypothetical protein FRC10_004849 [Ceratobasidium sp. 414]|nr:hypothetical protein FRC10_004849 [Ceratobasidium sp. 414]